MISPDQGDIVVDSDRIGFVFQDHRLLPWQTALDNIMIVLESKGIDPDSARRTAAQWLDRLGLKGYERSYPSQLSGGMAQRVSIARAFSIQPQIMLMDEPLSSLDRKMADSILRQLEGVLEEYRTTTIYVTHDIIEALDIGDRIFKLENYGLTELSITDRKTMLKDYIESRVKKIKD